MNHGGGLYSPKSAQSPPRSRKVFFSPQRLSDHSGFAASLFSLDISSLLISSSPRSCTPPLLSLNFLASRNGFACGTKIYSAALHKFQPPSSLLVSSPPRLLSSSIKKKEEASQLPLSNYFNKALQLMYFFSVLSCFFAMS